MRRRVHLVVDTGVDDALAIVVAWLHPNLELTGVTAAAGNVSLAQAWTNTRFVLDVVGGGARVPLSAGAAQRCDGRAFTQRSVHGRGGLAGLTARVSRTAIVEAAAPHVAAGTTLVCLAPMTTLLALPPGEVVATYARPVQANHAMDPQAAQAVRSAWQVHDVVPAATGPPPAPAEGAGLEVAGLPGLDAAVRGEMAPGVAGLVRALLAHQRQRGAGLGDAEAMLVMAR